MINFELIHHSVMTPMNKYQRWDYSKENSRTRRKMKSGFVGKGTNKQEIPVTHNLKYSKAPGLFLEEYAREFTKRAIFAQARRIGLFGKHIGSKPLSKVKLALRRYNEAVANLNKKVA